MDSHEPVRHFMKLDSGMVSRSLPVSSGEGLHRGLLRRSIDRAWLTVDGIRQSRPVSITCFLAAMVACVVTAQSMMLEMAGPSSKATMSLWNMVTPGSWLPAVGQVTSALFILGFGLAGLWCWPRGQQARDLPHAQGVAAYDHVTGLPTIRLFTVLLDQALAQAARLGRRIGVLVVELSQFRPAPAAVSSANETLIARVQAARIKSAMNSHDTVAQLGEQQFAVLIDADLSADQLEVRARHILEAVSHPFLVAGQEVLLSCRVGGALLGSAAVSGDGLLDQAFHALAQADEDHPFHCSNAEAGKDTGSFPPAPDRATSFELLRH